MATRKPKAETIAKPAVVAKTAKRTPKSAPAAKLRVTSNPKDTATKKGEPWVSVLAVELDPDNIQNGAFELDWNDHFVAKLVRAGYKGKDDAQMVEQWFQDICRNVLMENFEQWEVNQPPESRISKKDLGDGRSEMS